MINLLFGILAALGLVLTTQTTGTVVVEDLALIHTHQGQADVTLSVSLVGLAGFTADISVVPAGDGRIHSISKLDDDSGNSISPIVTNGIVSVRNAVPNELCIDNFEWDGTAWVSPHPNYTIGYIDLRSSQDKNQVGGVGKGLGLFILDRLNECVNSAPFAIFPADLDAPILTLEKTALEIGLGIGANKLTGITYRDTLLDLLVANGDVSGADRFQPTRSNLVLASFDALSLKALPDLAGEFETPQYGVRIEIQSAKLIPGGLEIVARAWSGTDQLGFGKTGTIEWERIRVYPPRIRLPDGTTRLELIDGELVQLDNFRADMAAATRLDLAHTIHLVGKPSTSIIPGTISTTTSTFFPDPSPETTTVDGYARRSGVNETWATIRAGNGTFSSDGSSPNIVRITSSATTDQWEGLFRLFHGFDTASIPDTDTIDAATFSFDATTKTEGFTSSVSLVLGTLASNTAVAAADYQGTVGNVTRQATDVTLASIVTAGTTYTDMVLNATGRGNINKTGVTNLGLKMNHDVDDSPPTWAASTASILGTASAEVADTTSDPKLVVTHAAAGGFFPVIIFVN